MIAAVLAVLAAALAFALCGPALNRALTPALAVRLLVPASLAVTAAVWFVLAVAAFTWIGQDSEIAALGPWSPQTLATQTPIPHLPAMAALGALVLAASCAILFLARRVRALLEVHRVCGRLGAPGALVVLDTDMPDAFTTPEPTGRIVVTRGMLRALPPDEQAALLAHERSHLVRRHVWWVLAIDLAAAANPLLSPVSRAVRHAVERWADEDAANALADRHLVARTVARAALARRAHHATARPVTQGTGGDVSARVRALLAPPTPPRKPAMVALAVLLTVLTLATATVQHDGERLFERAALAATMHC